MPSATLRPSLCYESSFKCLCGYVWVCGCVHSHEGATDGECLKRETLLEPRCHSWGMPEAWDTVAAANVCREPRCHSWEMSEAWDTAAAAARQAGGACRGRSVGANEPAGQRGPRTMSLPAIPVPHSAQLHGGLPAIHAFNGAQPNGGPAQLPGA
eukprot:scaffold135716_cov26-Tisochrysis_lutea.AAC.1